MDIYVYKICNFNYHIKCNYNRHLTTKKHLKNVSQMSQNEDKNEENEEVV